MILFLGMALIGAIALVLTILILTVAIIGGVWKLANNILDGFFQPLFTALFLGFIAVCVGVLGILFKVFYG